MGRLHQLTLGGAILLGLGPSVAWAADYCSLIVHVVSADGRRPEAIVSVKEKSGRIVERDPTSEDVKFCDLGIEPVTVTVGADGTCNRVTVADVPLRWAEPYLLTVTYNLDPCLGDAPPHAPVPTCEVLLRITDSEGAWLANASVQFQQSAYAPRQTDKAGRAQFFMKSGDRVAGSVSAKGYIAKTFSFGCSRLEPIHEEAIKLEKPLGH